MKDPMSFDMPPADPEASPVNNINPNINNQTIVTIRFVPKDPEAAQTIRPIRRLFVSPHAAREWVEEIQPPHGITFGSPIQANLKIASRLGISPDSLSNHNLIIEYGAADNDRPITPPVPSTPNFAPIPDRSSSIDSLRSYIASAALPDGEAELREDEPEAENSEEIQDNGE